jgi:prepilin-type N-terminal cleavage/methylation domain-containing protein
VRPRVLRAGDAGVTLIEVMVAMLVFAVVSSGVLGMLSLSVKETRDGRNRVQGAQLAARELEIVRNQFTSTAPGAGPESIVLNSVANPDPKTGAAGPPRVLDGTPYTVTRTARWTGSSSTAGVSPCDSGATDKLTYLHVHVEVSWPHMGGTPPVVSDTILTPPAGMYTSTPSGHIAVKVLDAAGGPQPGVTISLTAPGFARAGQTSADGCTVFAFLAPASYTTTVSSAGLAGIYVDQSGVTSPATTIGVTAGTIQKQTFSYDRTATLSFTYQAPAGFTIPTGIDAMPIKLTGSNLQPLGSRTDTGSGAPRVIPNLFPAAAGYGYAFGTCVSNTSAGTARTTPGATTSVGYQPAPVTVTVLTDADGTPRAGAQVTATAAADSGCTTLPSFTLGTTDANGQVLTSLPAGTWVLGVTGATAGTNPAPTDADNWPQPTIGSTASTHTIRVI